MKITFDIPDKILPVVAAVADGECYPNPSSHASICYELRIGDSTLNDAERIWRKVKSRLRLEAKRVTEAKRRKEIERVRKVSDAKDK